MLRVFLFSDKSLKWFYSQFQIFSNSNNIFSQRQIFQSHCSEGTDQDKSLLLWKSFHPQCDNTTLGGKVRFPTSIVPCKPAIKTSKRSQVSQVELNPVPICPTSSRNLLLHNFQQSWPTPCSSLTTGHWETNWVRDKWVQNFGLFFLFWRGNGLKTVFLDGFPQSSLLISMVFIAF